MVISINHILVRAIISVFLISICTNFVKSMNIVSPPDGSIFVFGTPIPINVINSDTDTATFYTATFSCAAGTYQITGLSLGVTYKIIPAGLHGLANLIITAAGGTTAVINIQITGTVPPTPSPSPIYTPTSCAPTNYPFPCRAEFECPKPCCPKPCCPKPCCPKACCPKPKRPCDKPINRQCEYSNVRPPNDQCYPKPNRPCDKPINRQCEYSNVRPPNDQCYPNPNRPCDKPINRQGGYSNVCSPNENKQCGITGSCRSSCRSHDRARLSRYSSFELTKPIPPKFYSPLNNIWN